MKLIITLVLTIIPLLIYGQSNEFYGLWIGTAEYRVENIAAGEIYDDFSDLIPLKENGEIDSVIWEQRIKVDSIKKANWVPKPVSAIIDTNYYPVHVLLSVKKNGKAVYKELGKPEQDLSWTQTEKNNEIKLDFDEPLILRLDSSHHLSMVYYEKDSMQKKILFEPLSPSFSGSRKDFISTLQNYSWNFSYVDKSDKLTANLSFENDTLTISTYKTDSAIYCSPGRWIIEEFSDHHFLFVNPDYIPFHLHLSKLDLTANPTIYADRYDLEGFPFKTEYPRLSEYKLAGSEFPSRKKLLKKTQSLTGKWKAIDMAFPEQDYYGFAKKIISYYLTYEFKMDNTVEINYGGNIKGKHGMERVDKNETIDWFISKEGNLIIFGRNYSSKQIASFKFINSDTIEIQKEMMSLGGRGSRNMTFRIKRMHNNK